MRGGARESDRWGVWEGGREGEEEGERELCVGVMGLRVIVIVFFPSSFTASTAPST